MSVLETFSLADRVILVTGGAGKYGRQIVEALAEAGAEVYVASRNLEKLKAQADELNSLGHNVHALELDQADRESVLSVRDAILGRSNRIDVLVNNAVLRPMKSAQDDAESAAAFAESMSVNATGLFIITRAFADAMAKQGSGSIINIGSTYGIVGMDPTNYAGTDMKWWAPDYCFHKGGMINFTRGISSYYGLRGVRCNCVSPGGFYTDNMPERFVKQYNDHTGLGRMANSTDLKGIMVFLASDASSYVTGANIVVDGGYTAK